MYEYDLDTSFCTVSRVEWADNLLMPLSAYGEAYSEVPAISAISCRLSVVGRFPAGEYRGCGADNSMMYALLQRRLLEHHQLFILDHDSSSPELRLICAYEV